jgi:hypothetical protein
MIGVSMIEPIRLGHQAAHTGELFHLVLRTTRTGVRHHEDRVDLALRRLSSSI